MKRVAQIFCSVALVALSVFPCQSQVTVNVLERVLMIQGPVLTGTAFTIDVDGRQYLITAKHMVAGLKEQDVIRVRKGNDWSPLKVTIFRCDDPVDIAVLVPPSQLTVSLPLEPSIDQMPLGGDAFFVGFPFGMEGSFRTSSNYPVGLPKRATVSSIESLGRNKGALIILDGYNNPGFSGAPILFRVAGRPDSGYKVAGVLTAFRSEAGPVRKAEEIRPEQITSDDRVHSRIVDYEGKVFRLGQETGELVMLNTGIAVGYAIDSAVDLIRKHPIGPIVTDNFVPK